MKMKKLISALMMSVFAFLFVGQAAFAGQLTTVETELFGTVGSLNLLDMAASAGDIHAVFSYEDSGTGLKYMFNDSSEGTVDVYTILSPKAMVGIVEADIAIDSSGKAGIAWAEEDTGGGAFSFFYKHQTGAYNQWGDTETVESAVSGATMSVALSYWGITDNPHMVRCGYGANDGVAEYVWGGASFGDAAAVDSGPGSDCTYIALKIDVVGGNMFALTTGSSSVKAGLNYHAFTGGESEGSWGTHEYDIATLSSVGGLHNPEIDLTTGEAPKPRIAFMDDNGDGSGTVYAAGINTNGGAMKAVVEASLTGVEDSSVGLYVDPGTGDEYIVYPKDSSNELWLASGNNTVSMMYAPVGQIDSSYVLDETVISYNGITGGGEASVIVLSGYVGTGPTNLLTKYVVSELPQQGGDPPPGPGVPEFSTYMLIVVILAGLTLMYRKYGTGGATAA